METKLLPGGIKALLGEYRRVIDELIGVIRPLTPEDLIRVVDSTTKDANCHSIQTILTHVICSGYGYTIYLGNSAAEDKPRPSKILYSTVELYIAQLNAVYADCELFFQLYPEIDLESQDPSSLIKTSWGQVFDRDQMMEHAIVHIMRHRRQIEKFILMLDQKQ